MSAVPDPGDETMKKAEESFDKVVCFGVVHHTPDPENAFMNLAKYVRRSGEWRCSLIRTE
jgi:2-polyprenyl-3-methyl-5-hydroxy-6-metoxy-1,4-benzoquinol methylase